jgi:gp6-like head-tail connector protein
MSRDLVTLDQAIAHLRADAVDPMIPLYVSAASEAVLVYLQDAWFLDTAGDVPVDSSGDPDGVPANIQAATLLLIGELYRNREGDQGGKIDAQFGYGFLPQSVLALLYPYRTPTFA